MRLKRKLFYNEARDLRSRLSISYREAKKLKIIRNPEEAEGVIIELVRKQMHRDFQNYAKDLERMKRATSRIDYSQQGKVQGLWQQIFQNDRVND